MVYAYTPAYYSSLHDSITSLCKTILPFSFKKRRLIAAEQRLSKQQSDNLKWQQDSFHQIFNLMGLQKEGIVLESEVSVFRTRLLETLIASPPDQEQIVILRDKLVFLQELLYAKCISEDEYHSSKRPLLQRLAVQGAEIDAKDVIIGKLKETSNEEWSEIDLNDENSLLKKESLHNVTNKSKPISIFKQIKSAVKNQNPTTKNELGASKENPFWDFHLKEKESEKASTLMMESLPDDVKTRGDDKVKKKQWGFDGFRKWKRSNLESETAPLPLNGERSDSEAHLGSCRLVYSPMGESPDTKQIKRKLHSDGSSSDFFIDKVLGQKIKKELSQIQTELGTKNPNLQFTSDQIEAISTRLPVDKSDLKKFFPKSWCDRYGEVVLDVVRKEFKEHVGEIENLRNVARDRHVKNSSGWETFEEDDENYHPNLFTNQDRHFRPNNKSCSLL